MDDTTAVPAFAAGDKVQLKSGSICMTVESCEPGASAKCVWFSDTAAVFMRETFSQLTLCKIEVAPPPETEPLPTIDPLPESPEHHPA